MTDTYYYRVTTHDLQPPIQGGPPTWDGSVPFELPPVRVDRSDAHCGAGWHVSRTPHDALRLAGLWPNGRPARLWACERVGKTCIEDRGDKLRASTWRIVEELPITDAILADLHRPMAGPGLPIEDLVADVQAWRAALARPRHDEAAVEAGLRASLAAVGLSWPLVRYGAARDAWAAWDARAALTVYVASRRGWTQRRPDLLTVGRRDAYAAGLAIAVPVPGGLGWAMDSGVSP